MQAGVAEMGTYIEDLDDEFRFFWDYFDFPDAQGEGDYTGLGNDGCIMIEEFEEGLRTLTEVNESTIINYWINYYYETYQITEYYWWIYHTRNGGFDWQAYRTRVPDGPAFDGKAMIYQLCEGSTTPIFLWYQNELCYFSTGTFGNTAPETSGSCTIPGHKSIGDDYDYGILQVNMQYTSQSEHTYQMIYDPLGDWGPTGQHTDLRFTSDATADNCATWLWERTDEYCAVCDQAGGYPDDDYFGEGTEYTYYSEYASETDSYSFGAFDATNQYDRLVSGEEEEEQVVVPAPPAPEPEVEDLGYYGEEYA